MKATTTLGAKPRVFTPFKLELHVDTEYQARALLCIFGCNQIAGKAVEPHAIQMTPEIVGRVGALISGVYGTLLEASRQAGVVVR